MRALRALVVDAAAQQDALLPKLLSGELRVPIAARFVERA
jgi:hypothetical protein